MKTIVIDGIIGYPKNWDDIKSKPNAGKLLAEFRTNQIKDIVDYKGDVLNVNLSSVGGDVNHAIQVRNAIANNSAEVLMEYTGWSASATTIIGTAGNIIAAENIMILPHEGRGVAIGVQENIEAYSKMLDKTNAIIAKMYADKTGKSEEEMRALMALNNGEGEWLTAKEAMEIGLIDEVYEPMQIAASFSPGAIGLPEIPKEKLSILNVINMGIFSKKEEKKPVINSIQLGDISAVYENELKQGSELQALGGVELKDDEYIVGDNKVIVENSIVKEVIEPKAEEVKEVKNQEIEALQTANADLKAQVENQATELDKIKATLEGIKSTHQTPEKSEVKEEKQSLPLNLEIKKMVKAEVAANLKEE